MTAKRQSPFETFAKIMEAENGAQVLITQEFDNEDNETPFKVTQRTDISGVKAEVSLCFATVKKRDDCFKKYSVETAQRFYDSVSAFITDNSAKQ